MNTQPVRVMADLETMGTAPGSAIVSIGAVKFGINGITDKFYERICLKSCMDAGLTIDPDTIKWWLKQSDEAREELTKPDGEMIHVALMKFTQWINLTPSPSVELWGCGANFDNALLGAAYDLLRMPKPWKFWNDRCYRTVKALHPEHPMQKRTGTHHNALDDAISQAEHLITLPSFRAMEGGGK